MMLPKSETKPRPTGYENVSLLTSGPLPPNAQEMLHIRFRSVLSNLRNEGGVILVDSTPMLPVSDSRLIARHADAVIFVVAQGRTRTSELTSALEKLRFAQANVVGLLLNFAGRDGDVAGSYRYGTYGTYGGYSGYNAPPAGSAASDAASRVEVSDASPRSRRSRRQRARDAARQQGSAGRQQSPAAASRGPAAASSEAHSAAASRQRTPPPPSPARGRGTGLHRVSPGRTRARAGRRSHRLIRWPSRSSAGIRWRASARPSRARCWGCSWRSSR